MLSLAKNRETYSASSRVGGRVNTDTLLGRAKSGPGGRFRIDGIPASDDEPEVQVNGSAVDYESGWVG